MHYYRASGLIAFTQISTEIRDLPMCCMYEMTFCLTKILNKLNWNGIAERTSFNHAFIAFYQMNEWLNTFS